MVNLKETLCCLFLASVMTICLSACGGSSTSTAPASSTAKTASWTNVSVRSYDGKININWDRATGASLGTALPTYNLYCSSIPTDIMLERNRIATHFSGTSFDHTNVTNGQRYYYAVTEVSTSGESPASRLVSATPQAVQPAAPFGLKVTASETSAKLELLGPTPASPVVTSYNLYRSTTRNSFTASNIIAAKIPFSTPYSDNYTDLNLGITYYYAVTAVVSGKESGFSPIVSTEPQAKTAAVNNTLPLNALASFASPADLSVEPGNGSCTVRWPDVAPLVISGSDPAGSTKPYHTLYWSDSPDVLNNIKGRINDVAKDTNGGFTSKITDLNNGTMYYFQVTVAVRGSDDKPIPGRFTRGLAVAATPALKTPAIPSGISATQNSQQVSLTWNKDSSGISGVTYTIYYSTSDAATPAELMVKGTRKNNDDPTKTYFNHTGLTAGTTYYYVVTAVGETESAPSSIISVTL
jgi:titin